MQFLIWSIFAVWVFAQSGKVIEKIRRESSATEIFARWGKDLICASFTRLGKKPSVHFLLFSAKLCKHSFDKICNGRDPHLDVFAPLRIV